ncbi:MAG: hypothetical protein PVF68_14045 [Acidobacteriota bacterium]|jgi:hypothetical protein
MFLIRALRMLFWVLLVLWILRLAGRMFRPAPPRAQRPPEAPPSPTPPQHLHRDPVCGTFLPADIALVETVDGQPVHFCSKECRDRYRLAAAQHG